MEVYIFNCKYKIREIKYGLILKHHIKHLTCVHYMYICQEISKLIIKLFMHSILPSFERQKYS